MAFAFKVVIWFKVIIHAMLLVCLYMNSFMLKSENLWFKPIHIILLENRV